MEASAESVRLVDESREITFDSLSSGKNYSLKFDGFKGCQASFYSAVFIDGEGVSLKEQKGTLTDAESVSVPVSTADLIKKKYFLRVKMSGKEEPNCFCLTIPVAVK